MTLQPTTRFSPQTGGAARVPPTYTPAEAQALADQHFAQAYHLKLRTYLLELVAGFGALTGYQLHRLAQRRFTVTSNFAHFERTLTRLCEADLLETLPDLALPLRRAGLKFPFSKVALPQDTRYRIYGLGPIGRPFAQRLWRTLGRDTRALLPADSLVHDLLCVEVMLRLMADKPTFELLAPGQVTLWNDAKQVFFCRPDGLLVEHRRHALPYDAWQVEFFNETWTHPERVQHKLALYQELVESKRWVEWQLDEPPHLLVVYRAYSTGEAFLQAAAQLPIADQLYGLALENAFDYDPPALLQLGASLRVFNLHYADDDAL